MVIYNTNKYNNNNRPINYNTNYTNYNNNNNSNNNDNNDGNNVFMFVLLGKTSVDKPLLEYMSKKLNT